MQIEPFGDDIRNPVVPRSLAASRIWSQGGYAAVSGMIGRSLLDALKAEAESAPVRTAHCPAVFQSH
jgi:hypothetical protein